MWIAALLLLIVTAASFGAEAPITFSPRNLPFRLENFESANRYAPETMPGGVALLDYDNDGDLDLFFPNGAALPAAEKTSATQHDRLYRNDGSAGFEDVTDQAGLAGIGYNFGAAAADYDNDGDQDLFVAGLHRNTLYRNDEGRFTDVTRRAGLGSDDEDFGPLWSIAGAWLDFDNDGLLDLFVVNYLSWKAGTDPVCDESGERDYCHPKFYKGTPNKLYRNRGDGTFEDVSAAAGIRSNIGKGMGAAVADFDGDGLMDIFVTNDKLPNFLFHNEGGGRFSEIAFEATAALPDSGREISGMGLDARDLNQDGLPDIVYTALPGETFPLLLNTRDGYFRDATLSSGLAAQTRDMAGYSAIIADFDNDGRKDIFFSRGDVQALPINKALEVRQHNSVFRNLADGKFVGLTEEAGFSRIPKRRHRGAAAGDLNGDGKLDLVVTALGDHAEIWLNNSPGENGRGENHWVEFALEGVESNRDGIGAAIRIETGGKSQHSHKTTSVGYGSSSAGAVHFGLGRAEVVESVEIRWPSGRLQRLEKVRADHVVRVREPSGSGR